MTEEWRAVVGYEELYEVSNQGQVRSVNRTRKGRYECSAKVRGQMLKPMNQNGYLLATLRKDGIQKHWRIHRLVADAFIPNENPERNLVNHIDGDKSNNNVTNLEWCTYSENAVHAISNGLWHSTKGKTINKSAPNSHKRYNSHEIEMILSSDYTAKEIALMLGRTVSSINHIRSEHRARKEQE